MKKFLNAYKQELVETQLKPVEEYFPLVHKITNSFIGKIPNSVEYHDLFQTGVEGLLQAYQRFNPLSDLSSTFETFAYTRIKGAILDFLRGEDILSREDRKKIKQIQQEYQKILQTNTPFSYQLLAEKTQFSIDEVFSLMSHTENFVLSLDDLTEFSDTAIASQQPTPEQAFDAIELAQQLENFLKTLPLKEQQIISLHLTNDLNFKEIAHILELSESRICQIYNEIILKIKTHLSKNITIY